jgi:hypothetical protein
MNEEYEERIKKNAIEFYLEAPDKRDGESYIAGATAEYKYQSKERNELFNALIAEQEANQHWQSKLKERDELLEEANHLLSQQNNEEEIEEWQIRYSNLKAK